MHLVLTLVTCLPLISASFQTIQPLSPLSKEQCGVSITHKNGVTTESFFIDPDANATEVYFKAEQNGLYNPQWTSVIQDNRGRIIPNQPSVKLSHYLSPSNCGMPPFLTLNVLDLEQVIVTVVITNGKITKSFDVNAATDSNKVYEKAMEMGLITNQYQFVLKVERDDLNHSMLQRTTTLIDCIDVMNANEFRLTVSPIPEGALLYLTFREMTPNQNVSFWNYAQFCYLQSPWNPICQTLSKMHQYRDHPESADGYLDIESKAMAMDWNNVISILNVPPWEGKVHLEYLPNSVHSLCLKGFSLNLDFEAMQYTSLKELRVDFRKRPRIDIEALWGSKLEILRVSSQFGMTGKDLDGVLSKLTKLKAQGSIQLDLIDFGHGLGIIYDPQNEAYDSYTYRLSNDITWGTKCLTGTVGTRLSLF